MKYAAVIFDIVDSRRYDNRYIVQEILMESISYLNDIYRNGIEKEVVSSAGDEFQGLFNNLQAAFLYIRKLQLLIYPIKIRCGVGYGTIKYKADKWSSLSLDGDAYYLSRDAINSIRKKKSNAICFNTNSVFDKYLNVLCMSGNEIKSRQSRNDKLIELVSDIILPINQIKESDESTGFYEFILQNRNELIEDESWNKVLRISREKATMSVNFDYVFDNRKFFKEQSNSENKFNMEDFWAYGMNIYIAKTLNTTRQNVDGYVTLGKIKESRTIDKAIYELLGEIYGKF